MGCLKLSYGEKNYTGLKVVYSNAYENENNCTGAYRYGFNGQEKDDEIAGNGNSYTAEFWQYDSRIGRRWNVDPVVKPWRSGYNAFDNSPIWKVDPNGDDDYYNKKGQYIGSHGENNGVMRVVGSSEIYNNVIKTNTHEGKIIVVDPSAGSAVKQAASNSYGSGKEWVAIITFDPEKAIISGEVFEQGSNYSPIQSSAPTKEEYEQKNPNKILLATSHGHPKEQRDGRDNAPGPSPGDIVSVEQTKVPEYQVDAYKIEHVEATNTGGTGNITVVNKDKTVTPNVGTVGKIGTGAGKFNIGKDALERSGGKPKK
jgi:hypothetical protein